jgi:hypothetical protein
LCFVDVQPGRIAYFPQALQDRRRGIQGIAPDALEAKRINYCNRTAIHAFIIYRRVTPGLLFPWVPWPGNVLPNKPLQTDLVAAEASA